jgi:CelD/BcsL family acetyltransferase involved in cellulose biosynthesis
MDIEVIGDSGDLQGIRPEWDALVAASAMPRPSLTHGWFTASARHYGAPNGSERFTLCFRDGGRLVGLAPLRVCPKRIGGVPVARSLQFDVEMADCRDLVIEAGAEWGVVEAYCEWLREGPLAWDVLRLRGLCSRSPTQAYLPLLARHYGCCTTLWSTDACAYIHLPASVSEYLEHMPSQQRRRTYAYNRRRVVKEHGEPRLRVVAGDDVTEADLRRVWELHCSGWRGRGGSDVTSERFRLFLRDLPAAVGPSGRPVLAFLQLGDRDVTGDYGFLMDGRYFLYFGGFDPEFARYSVGHLALLALVEFGIEQGWTEIDLMKGGERYKFGFTRCTAGAADLWMARTPARLRAATALALLRARVSA